MCYLSVVVADDACMIDVGAGWGGGLTTLVLVLLHCWMLCP